MTNDATASQCEMKFTCAEKLTMVLRWRVHVTLDHRNLLFVPLMTAVTRWGSL